MPGVSTRAGHREDQTSQGLERLQRGEEVGRRVASGSECKGPTCSDPPGPALLGSGGAASAGSGWGRSRGRGGAAGAVGAVSAGGLGWAGPDRADLGSSGRGRGGGVGDPAPSPDPGEITLCWGKGRGSVVRGPRRCGPHITWWPELEPLRKRMALLAPFFPTTAPS